MPRPAKEHTEKMVSVRVTLKTYNFIKKKAKWGEPLGSVLERILRVRGKFNEPNGTANPSQANTDGQTTQ